jgi:regulator of replication initiation timing
MKALVGSWENRPYRLLAELTALRTRVGELQEELALAREENAMLREALRDDDIEVVFSAVSNA